MRGPADAGPELTRAGRVGWRAHLAASGPVFEGAGVSGWHRPWSTRRWALEAKGSPGVVEAVRVGEADIAAGSHALCVAALHPHD